MEESLTRVTPRTVVDEATDALRAAIVDRRYEPGQHLVERQLAAQLGVSSIAIREAFGRLAEEGLVVKVPRRGTFVASMSPDVLRDLTRVRVLLEQLVVELAIENWSPSAHAEVQGIVDDMRAAARRDDHEGVFVHDNRFHAAFWRIAGSPTLLDVTRNLRGRLAGFLREASRSLVDQDRLEWSVDIHQSWLDAVSAGDADRAKAEVHHQIWDACDRIVASLEAAPPQRSRSAA